MLVLPQKSLRQVNRESCKQRSDLPNVSMFWQLVLPRKGLRAARVPRLGAFLQLFCIKSHCVKQDKKL